MQFRRAFSLLATALALAQAEGSDVTQLTKATFDDFVKSNDLVLAECEYPR
jgi:protein disulfide-isomerase A1